MAQSDKAPNGSGPDSKVDVEGRKGFGAAWAVGLGGAKAFGAKETFRQQQPLAQVAPAVLAGWSLASGQGVPPDLDAEGHMPTRAGPCQKSIGYFQQGIPHTLSSVSATWKTSEVAETWKVSSASSPCSFEPL
ncbi:hypothetical protein VCV18_010299 [Metarhizium anisopliae]